MPTCDTCGPAPRPMICTASVTQRPAFFRVDGVHLPVQGYVRTTTTATCETTVEQLDESLAPLIGVLEEVEVQFVAVAAGGSTGGGGDGGDGGGGGLGGAAPTNRSGTITAGGTAQELLASSTTRYGLSLLNLSAGDIWLSFFGPAAASAPAIRIAAGALYETPPTCYPRAAVSIFGATTGQAFTAFEW